jgi:hypothetical protein
MEAEKEEKEQEKWRQMAAEEAEAVNRTLPEVEKMNEADRSGEEHQNGQSDAEDDDIRVDSGGLKRLFKQIVKNANTNDKIDVKKEYGALM